VSPLAVQSASGSSFERIPETTCNIYATNLRDVTLGELPIVGHRPAC
jgi:hypothetical protein